MTRPRKRDNFAALAKLVTDAAREKRKHPKLPPTWGKMTESIPARAGTPAVDVKP